MTQESDCPFSRRLGYHDPDPKITIREAAPDWLRNWFLKVAKEYHLVDGDLLQIKRQHLPEIPEYDSRSPSVEVLVGLNKCKWYKSMTLPKASMPPLTVSWYQWEFEGRLNKLFRERGVGWQMRDGRVEFRGSEPFNVVTGEASDTLAGHGRQTAAREIHEALQDLSRRPEPDLSGAVHHAMAALECVAREVSGEGGATLGQIIKQRPEALGLPPPLDQALAKLWGYASEQGRHLREGREPGLQETELVVSVAAAVSVYLSKRG